MAETVEAWNSRLIGSNQKPDKRKEKQQSHVVEDITDMSSETEGSVSPDTHLLDDTESKITESTSSSATITKKIKSLDHGDCKFCFGLVFCSLR